MYNGKRVKEQVFLPFNYSVTCRESVNKKNFGQKNLIDNSKKMES